MDILENIRHLENRILILNNDLAKIFYRNGDLRILKEKLTDLITSPHRDECGNKRDLEIIYLIKKYEVIKIIESEIKYFNEELLELANKQNDIRRNINEIKKRINIIKESNKEKIQRLEEIRKVKIECERREKMESNSKVFNTVNEYDLSRGDNR